MKKFLAVVLEMTRNAVAKITFSRKRIARYCTALPFRAVIGLTVLSLLDCVALGQGVLSGSAVFSGRGRFGYPTVSPLTYSARTDNCATGVESGCVAQGGTGQPLTFLIRPSDSPTFAANAPANTAATDPDFHSYLIMVTDPTTNGTATTSYNMGSGSCEEIAFGDGRKGRYQLLGVLRASGITCVCALFVSAVEPSYAGVTCSARFRPNHLVRL